MEKQEEPPLLPKAKLQIKPLPKLLEAATIFDKSLDNEQFHLICLDFF